MAVLRDFDLRVDVDQVLRGQGADPDIIRARRPQLVAAAERALAEGAADLEPIAAYGQMPVESLSHDRLVLVGGRALRGPLIAQHLGGAQRVVAAVCTIGPRLEERSRQILSEDPVLALALDGLGSAAAEALAALVAHHFEVVAAAEGLETSLPLSPGMVGWPLAEGQAEVFALVNAREAGVTLTETGMMIPRKSVSFVLGIGVGVATQASACDFCNLRQTCRYQDHYPEGTAR